MKDKLEGEDLGCYCKPKPCHGDVVKDYFEYKNMIRGMEEVNK